MHRLAQAFREATTPAEYVTTVLGRMATLVAHLNPTAIGRVVDEVRRAGQTGRAVYTLGNGGSAVVASHFVNDMGVNSLVDGRSGYRVVCLADNAASVTAVANDAAFEEIFRAQLRCLLEPDDVVIAMSVSGNSENVVRAVEYANDHGAVSIGFCGFSGGRLAELARHVVHVPASADEYGPVEDAFSVICHLVSSYLTMERGRFLHH